MLTWWWVLYLIGGLGGSAFGQTGDTVDATTLAIAEMFAVVGHLVTITAGVLIIIIVRRITAMQERLAAAATPR